MARGKQHPTCSGSINDQDSDDERGSNAACFWPDVPRLVAGKFLIGHRIGSGSFGNVHAGEDNLTHRAVAVKFELQKAIRGKKLLRELRLYNIAVSSGSLPRIHWYGSDGDYNILVMELLGPSLEQLLCISGGKFSLKTVLMLAVQMIERIELLHSNGIIHRDIKPDNFCMGLGSRSDRVYILDLGLSREYRDARTGRHIPCTHRRGVMGTVQYASLNVHLNVQPSRRDDLEALGYVLMYFLRGRLPWDEIKAASKQARNEDIRFCKKWTTHATLCEGFPGELVKYFQHCRSLKFADEADYELLRSLMRAMFMHEQLRHDLRFDWTVAGYNGGPPRRPDGDIEPLDDSCDNVSSVKRRGKAK